MSKAFPNIISLPPFGINDVSRISHRNERLHRVALRNNSRAILLKQLA